MKKIIAMILTLVLVVSYFPISVFAVSENATVDIWDGSIANGFEAGDGTESNPFIIKTGAQLAYLAKETNGGNCYKDTYFKLQNDIDLNNIPWMSIGHSSYNKLSNIANSYYPPDMLASVAEGHRFSGVFDGNGNTICNIKFPEDYKENHIGLFDMSDGEIRNLCVEALELSIQSKSSDKKCRIFGGIVAVQYGGVIENCSFNGNVNGGDFACAGIVGYAENTVIKNCTTKGTLSQTTNKSVDRTSARVYYTSGILSIGYNVSISGCENFAEITGSAECVYIAGIVGDMGKGGSIDTCTNYGKVSNTKAVKFPAHVAGIGSTLDWGTEEQPYSYYVNSCNNYGDVQGGLGSGGIIAESGLHTNVYINNCSNFGDIYDEYCAGGILGSAYNVEWASIRNSFNTGDITSNKHSAGGIVGGGNNVHTIQNCYNTGTVKTINTEKDCYGTGGIVGGLRYGSRPTIRYCYNIGSVSSKRHATAIGALGYCYGSSCYYLDNVSRGLDDTAHFKAEKLTALEMRFAENFSGFDFKNIWDIDPSINNGYPYLRGMEPRMVIDTSSVKFSKTKNDLEYPIYDKTTFANQLKVWAENSTFSDSFAAYMEEGHSYNELLDMTIDLPVMSDEGVGYSVSGETTVGEMMAYLIFADNARKYIKNVEFSVSSKFGSGNQDDAYKYFYEKLMNFNLQYNYFQKELNEKDTFNQTLTTLLLAKTAMSVVDELKIKYKNGETKYLIYGSDEYNDTVANLNTDEIESTVKLKSYSYITGLYKANVNESYQNYDSLYYYLMSGGDTSFLNEKYKDVLNSYSIAIKDGKKIYKILKKGDFGDASSLIGLGLDNIKFFSERNNSEWQDDIQKIKQYWDYIDDGYNLLKNIATYSPFGVMSSAWEIGNTYIEKIKEAYSGVEKREFGWYALTYYYLEKNNPDLLHAIIDSKTGSAEFNISNVTIYGIPYHMNDIIEENIVKHWNSNKESDAYLQHTYTPKENIRLYMMNSCNNLQRMASLDIDTYCTTLLEYILAEIGLEKGIAEQYVNIDVVSNDENLGSVSKSIENGGTSVNATTKENASFVGWFDSTTGDTVSQNPNYEPSLSAKNTLQAVFVEGEVKTASVASILSVSEDQKINLGGKPKVLHIDTATSDNGVITIKWYKNYRNSNQDGIFVTTGASYSPPADVKGTTYYYAIVENTLVDGSVTTTTKVRSRAICVSVEDPIVVDLEILRLPSKTIYLPEEEFSSNGLSVCMVYSDGSKATVTDYEAIYEEFDTIGIKNITVKYLGFAKTFDVEVTTEKSGKLSDTVSWKLNLLTKELTVSGYGAIPVNSYITFTPYNLYINSLVVSDGITDIGTRGFYNLTYLENVILPNSLVSIGDYGFTGCRKLTGIELPKGLESIGTRAFYSCSYLASIEIPNTLLTIDSYAFYGCSRLFNVTIPESVVTINSNAFNSRYLKSIYGLSGTTAEMYAQENNIPFSCLHTYASITNIEATCIANGHVNALVCPNCQQILEQGTLTDMLEHTYGEWVIDTPAMPDRVGIKHRICSICGNTETEEIAQLKNLKFAGATLTLYDDLSINYRVARSLFEESGYTEPYVVFSLNGEETKVTEYMVVGDYYTFDFDNISPHQMNDTIFATLYANYEGKEYVSETKEYSVATYCYNMLDKHTTDEYAKLRTLLVDLLRYGEKSQIYKNYKTDNLVSSRLTEEQNKWGTEALPELKSVQDTKYETLENPSVKWKGAGLNLQDSVTMRFMIATESIENLTVKVTSDSGEWTISNDAFEKTEGGYYVFFNGLNAGQMSETVYLTVYNGETKVSNTVRYSIESYAHSMQNSADGELNDLLTAMMKYGNSAYSYQH